MCVEEMFGESCSVAIVVQCHDQAGRSGRQAGKASKGGKEGRRQTFPESASSKDVLLQDAYGTGSAGHQESAFAVSVWPSQPNYGRQLHTQIM